MIAPFSDKPHGKSTGPRSAIGKRRSSLNSIKNGLSSRATVLPGIEDYGEFERFARSIIADLGVAGSPVGMALAERLISALWRSRRVRRFEQRTLSKKAERVLTARAASESYRQTAFSTLNEAKAVSLISKDRRMSKADLQAALDGVDRYVEMFDSVEIFCFVDSLLSSKRRSFTGTEVWRAFSRGRKTIAAEMRERDFRTFLVKVRIKLEAYALTLEAYAEKNDREAASAETDSLMLDHRDGRRITDAEARLDRQVSRALQDLAAAQALILSC